MRSSAAPELESACYAERVAAMEVEVFVVDIKGAADADLAGLINPLLHCFQNCVFNVNVWAMPAVEVRCALHCHPCRDTRPVKPGQELKCCKPDLGLQPKNIASVAICYAGL